MYTRIGHRRAVCDGINVMSSLRCDSLIQLQVSSYSYCTYEVVVWSGRRLPADFPQASMGFGEDRDRYHTYIPNATIVGQ